MTILINNDLEEEIQHSGFAASISQ